MRDWSAFVRQRLGKLHVSPEREAEIVAELTQQIEQAYSESIAGGSGEDDARRRAESHLGDWGKLTREINAAEKPLKPAAEYRGGLLSGVSQDVKYALR